MKYNWYGCDFCKTAIKKCNYTRKWSNTLNWLDICEKCDKKILGILLYHGQGSHHTQIHIEGSQIHDSPNAECLVRDL